MTEVYDALGKDIVMGAIVKAKDVSQIEECIIRELERRGIATTPTTIAQDGTITAANKNAIHSNCVAAGYTNDETGVSTISAAQLQRYISFIKELYKKIVVP